MHCDAVPSVKLLNENKTQLYNLAIGTRNIMSSIKVVFGVSE